MNRRSFFSALAGAPIAVVAAKAAGASDLRLSLRGLGPVLLYSGEQVRELAGQLIDHQRGPGVS